jgi:hypothetical protein
MEALSVAICRHIVDENVPHGMASVAALTQYARPLFVGHAEQAPARCVLIEFLRRHFIYLPQVAAAYGGPAS